MGITSVRIRANLSERLDKTAARLHRSKSSVINQAVEEFLDHEQQEQQRWQETLEALDSVRNGRITSGTAVHAWLKSWGTDKELPTPATGQE
ncbi:MAG: ribbon-helix-helix protein, CopG family [Mariprofundaceae bacterium]|nr:ribbon-helix-helix protein, CopG family [Mariprofundaceae bacterium]